MTAPVEPRMEGIAPPPLPAPKPAAADLERQNDDAQLRLLSGLHYALAVVTALFALFPLLYLVLGISMLSGGLPMAEGAPSSTHDVRMIGIMFTAMGTLFLVFVLSVAGLIAYAGRCLAHKQRYTLCLVAAGVSCTAMPLGTVLGVFTLVTLTRASMRARFTQPAPASPVTA